MGSDREQGAHFHGRAPSSGSNSQRLEAFGSSSVTAAMSAQALPPKGTLHGDGPCIPHCCQPACLDSACSGAFQTFHEPFFHPQRGFASSGRASFNYSRITTRARIPCAVLGAFLSTSWDWETLEPLGCSWWSPGLGGGSCSLVCPCREQALPLCPFAFGCCAQRSQLTWFPATLPWLLLGILCSGLKHSLGT